MNDIIASIAVILGVVLGVLSAVGILRMPDVYIRLQVASKASSLGVALLMLGVAVHFGELGVTVRALLVVMFLFLTAPVAAHVIGRAAYLTGVPLAAGTDPDQLAGAYDRVSGRLMSPAERLLHDAAEPGAAPPELDPVAADLVADMRGQEVVDPAVDGDPAVDPDQVAPETEAPAALPAEAPAASPESEAPAASPAEAPAASPADANASESEPPRS